MLTEAPAGEVLQLTDKRLVRATCAHRRKGYAVDPGNYISGVTVVGAPVIHRHRVSHVIVGIGLTEQLKLSRVPRLGKDLVAAAKEISGRLNAI